jgi:myo-inositol-1(or 4)-monophosphatase
MGEEGGLTGPPESPWTWLIDPIDGTTNYAHGLPIWAVSIGLLEGGLPRWGCVYVPRLELLYTASRGKGATQNGRPMAPLVRHRLEREDLFGITSDAAKRWDFFVPQKLRAMGSAAAQAVFVASGQLAGYFLDEWYIWDIAAALLVAQETGVRVTDLHGAAFTCFPNLEAKLGPPLLFAAPGIHAQILPLIRPKSTK